MRGYVTRGGIGILAGVASLALVAATQTARLDCRARLPLAGDPAVVGPFRMAVERFEIHQSEDGPVAVVQLHLWRPAGPVPLSERVRIDGTALMSGAWELTRSTWLIRNELMRVPEGPTLRHRYLGAVPATRHAGEARAVLEFAWICPASAPAESADFAFELPEGQIGCIAGLQAVRR